MITQKLLVPLDGEEARSVSATHAPRSPVFAITSTPSLTPGCAAPNPATLQLAVLGPPIVRVGGGTVALRTRKEFALLVYLVFSRLPRSREHLASLLWPDRDGPAARGTLRTSLSRLRQAVAAAASLPVEALTLFSTGHDALGRDVIRLDREGTPRLALDTAPVEAAAASKGDEGGAAAHEARLCAAVVAYRGPFLADITFDDAPGLEDWVQEQRAFWQRQVEALLGRLAALQLERRAFAEAGATAERWLGIDPLEEAAYRALMRARAGAGDRAGALAAYEDCRAALGAQLAVEPAPETVALVERLRRLAAPRTPPTDHAPAEPTGVVGPPRRELELPFVGREREFAALVEAYLAARAGEQRVVVIEGEARIGKTRLAEEFLRWAILENADVVRARGLAVGEALPYQIIVDALRPRLAREHAPEDLVDEVWLAELVRLFPELRERYPDLPAPAQLADDAAGPVRLFEAVHQLERALAERARPGALVGFYDDLHWADQSSLDLLLHGAQRGHESGAPSLIVVTVRTEALTSAPEIEGWLTRLAHGVAAVRLVLGPLEPAETEQALETLLAPAGGNGEESRRFLVRALQAQTGGHPFYLVETLRELVEQGILVARDDAADPRSGDPRLGLAAGLDRLPPLVPRTVRPLIADHLARLGSAAADLLAAAAVLGAEATFERLCAVAELDDWAGLLALDELCGRRLLVEEGPDPGLRNKGPDRPVTYRFACDLVRRVVCAKAGDPRRRVLHLRVCAACERGRAVFVLPDVLAQLQIGPVEAAAAECPLLRGLRCGVSARRARPAWDRAGATVVGPPA
jgi:DNA-binding SARP family transcriptional activator